MDGVMDVESVRPFIDKIKRAIKRGNPDLVIDMGDLESISGGAMGALLIQQSEAERNGGVIKLARTPDTIYRVLHANGLAEVFETYKSIDDAAGSFDVNRRRNPPRRQDVA
jgi:anti-anti-sigma factor